MEEVEILRPRRIEYYDFETERIPAEDVNLRGTEYRVLYANGWERAEEIDRYNSSIDIGGKTLSAHWKYTEWDEDDEEYYVQKRDDNALVYTYGNKTMEFPAKFDVPSPVESLEVTAHLWEDKGVYKYKANNLDELEMTVDIHFNDGREDETVKIDGRSTYHNGYYMRLAWKGYYLEPGQENMMVLSYMGKTVEIPIMVLENPVESMQILQLPEKAEYYPFEYGMDVADFDLYGIKIQINYKDGTEQIVEGTEHGDEIEVPGAYKETLSVITECYDWWECSISYMGCETWLRYKDKKFTAEDAVALRFEEEKTLAIEGGYQIFSFVAPETGNYRFEYEIEDHYDNWIVIYGATNRELGSARKTYMDYEMTGGKQYYIAAVIDTLAVKEITCSVTRVSDRERENIQSVDLPLRSLEAGDWLPEFDEFNDCYVDKSKTQWLNDAGNDAITDYGCAHRVKLVLKPYRDYQFTTATSVTVNGKRLATKFLASDGTIIMYYTFPYTKCKVAVPDVEGYELDESQNAEAGVCGYGEDYKFRYTEDPGNADSRKLIVKAGGKVLVPDADGYYVVESVDGNVTVTAKTDSLQAGEGESGLRFYNKSMEIFDIMIGRRNAKIADNENGEDALPVLESYEDGSDQFFFGWYLDKDASINGKGTRFTSQSVLLNPAYSLYAKWGSGYFSYIMNNKQINCKILSIDEHNRTKVQVGDGSNKRMRAARASASPAAFMQDMRGTASGVFVIPETIDLKDNADLAKLGVDFTVGEVTAIADNAFAGETGITDISLPKTVEQIGSGAFAGCASLTSVEIPEGVSLIGENVFNGCESLQSVAIPSTVGAIPEGAFQGCANLADVAIAEGVSEIGAGAFQGCGSLATVALPDTIESVDAAAFPANEGLTIICSSQMKESDVVQAVQEATGASVQAVDVDLDCAYDEKQFTFGDKAQTFTAGVRVDGTADPGREIVWKYPDTTAYGFSVSQDNRSITVTPRRVTSEDESIAIAAVDKETGASRSVSLRTDKIDFGAVDGDRERVYSIQEIASQDYTGKEICPQVVVVNSLTKEVVGAENYDVAYEDNIYVGTAYVSVKGKGNCRGSLYRSFEIDGVKKEVQILTVADTEITKKAGDAPFELSVSTSGDGAISFQSSDTSVASVGNTSQDRGIVTLVGPGTAEITVTASETERYYAASKVIRLTVEDKDGSGDKDDDGDKDDGGNKGDDGDKDDGGNKGDDGDKDDGGNKGDDGDKDDGGNKGDNDGDKDDGGNKGDNDDKDDGGNKGDGGDKDDGNNKDDGEARKDSVIMASDITKTYGAADFMVKADVTGNGVVSYEGSDGKVIGVDPQTGKVEIAGAGTAQIIIKISATEEYNEAEKTINVTVRKADAKLKAAKKSYAKVYGAKPFKLGVTAKAKISYKSSNKKVAEFKKGKLVVKACGAATITVSVKDKNYVPAFRKITVKVLPKKAAAKKAVSRKAGQMTISWKKQKEAAGYVVQYSTDKKFKKKVKSVDIKKNKTTQTTLKKLAKGKKYYVRVKAYTKAGKKKEFGAASKAVNAKVKK